MLKKIIVISIILIMILPLINALCGDTVCDQNEKNTCCIDCGCSFGQQCIDNTCVNSITFFSFSPEISIFLLLIIILLATFIVGYGLNIIKKAHNKYNKFSILPKHEKPRLDKLNKVDIEKRIIEYIKQGKSLKYIKKELYRNDIDPKLAEELLNKIIDFLISKAKQGYITKWDPRIIDNIFEEIMKKEHNEELEEYIGIALARGYSQEQIKKNLVSVGWSEKEINKVFKEILKK